MSFSLDRFFRPTGTRFRVFAQAPVLADFQTPETIWVSSPAGSLGPGPSDPRMYALDPVAKQAYGAMDLPPYRGRLRRPVLPDRQGHFDHLAPDDPGFMAAHVFGTVRRVLDVWETYLGGPLPWHFALTHPRLELIPHVAWNNAHFGWGFLECGEAADDAGTLQPFALNFDVLAHETGHGLVFSLVGMPTPETLTTAYRGLHEAASDLVAMLTVLHFRSFVDHVLQVTEGDLYLENELNRIGELSETRQIRSASNALRMADVIDPRTPPGEVEGKAVHKLGLPLIGAVFDILVEFYLHRLVEMRLIAPDLAAALRRAAGESAAALATVDDRPLRAAYAREPRRFAAALADARDMVGLRLAQTLHRLTPHFLQFETVATSFLAVDRQLTGATHQALIAGCFHWREIGTTERAMAPRPRMG